MVSPPRRSAWRVYTPGGWKRQRIVNGCTIIALAAEPGTVEHGRVRLLADAKPSPRTGVQNGQGGRHVSCRVHCQLRPAGVRMGEGEGRTLQGTSRPLRRRGADAQRSRPARDRPAAADQGRRRLGRRVQRPAPAARAGAPDRDLHAHAPRPPGRARPAARPHRGVRGRVPAPQRRARRRHADAGRRARSSTATRPSVSPPPPATAERRPVPAQDGRHARPVSAGSARRRCSSRRSSAPRCASPPCSPTSSCPPASRSTESSCGACRECVDACPAGCGTRRAVARRHGRASCSSTPTPAVTR